MAHCCHQRRTGRLSSKRFFCHVVVTSCSIMATIKKLKGPNEQMMSAKTLLLSNSESQKRCVCSLVFLSKRFCKQKTSALSREKMACVCLPVKRASLFHQAVHVCQLSMARSSVVSTPFLLCSMFLDDVDGQQQLDINKKHNEPH